MNTSRERPAKTFNGYFMLFVLLAIVVVGVWLVAGGFPPAGAERVVKLLFVGSVLLAIVGTLLVASGFYMIQPNQAAVITLFGAYSGTDRTEGLRWIWPWMMRKKISARAHNVHSDRVKINDLKGNPIDIACNVVWRVADTAQAAFDVDDFKEFVNIQIEAGLRTVGARHPYDDLEQEETTLRGSPDVVNRELQVELNERLNVAGIVVDEAGLTHLAYAPEIAGAMLRRQQAEAVIAARAKLVMGAVSMVEMALAKLSEDEIVELDDERRATMVSNLMVVLCGEREAQPVVNAGTLYQ
ncbi:MAG: SPFH domain-containing protein [Tsuneonella suprasediminis]|uniref:SPFH domain-containing protein n=2 Tax=Tsuneonella suprasediminis TaxID=2306996 RepID=A0A419QYA4_9SPHN|nr:SPFH domain-containing protein [Tsuneonella suprasediminis]RJX65629.1 SPFH domain-containing protein [Tsuneonella suprasediminis]UBS34606.1 SPFH domain-containing protein [Altererythrobacter sp. N1]